MCSTRAHSANTAQGAGEREAGRAGQRLVSGGCKAGQQGPCCCACLAHPRTPPRLQSSALPPTCRRTSGTPPSPCPNAPMQQHTAAKRQRQAHGLQARVPPCFSNRHTSPPALTHPPRHPPSRAHPRRPGTPPPPAPQSRGAAAPRSAAPRSLTPRWATWSPHCTWRGGGGGGE